MIKQDAKLRIKIFKTKTPRNAKQLGKFIHSQIESMP
jgi:predicted NAD-dependent protein-ADP-ribosyltransferase YbiA (DUF1768 family)